MDIDGKPALRCEDKECRAYETLFRRILFQREYFLLIVNLEPGKNIGRIKAAIAAPEKYHYHIR